MGSTFFGSDAKQVGTAELMTPEQQAFLGNILNTTQPYAIGTALQGMMPFNPQQTLDFYNQNLVNPAIQTYGEDILPQIQQRFITDNAGSSSALNQALARSATDLSKNLSGQLGTLLFEGQNQAQNRQLSTLSQVLGLLGQRSFDPITQGPQNGILNNLLGAAGNVGSALIGRRF